jgi:hypothetical protein
VKVSVDQSSQIFYIPISNQQSPIIFHEVCMFQSPINNHQSSMKWVAVQIFLRFEERKAWCLKEMFVKYRQSQE